MSNKFKKQVRARAAKTGQSYQAAYQAIPRGESGSRRRPSALAVEIAKCRAAIEKFKESAPLIERNRQLMDEFTDLLTDFNDARSGLREAAARGDRRTYEDAQHRIRVLQARISEIPVEHGHVIEELKRTLL
jgi:hypothetical protein